MPQKTPQGCFPIFKKTDEKYTPYAVLIVAVLMAYANVYHNTFVSDDLSAIVYNGFLKHWSNLPDIVIKPDLTGAGYISGFYRPVMMLIYFFIYQMCGLSTLAFHAVNIALHITNACLVCCLGCRLGLRQWTSFSAALIWAVHPLHTEAVTFISATAEPLYSFFLLLGLIGLLPDFAPRKFWIAGLFFILALASKESAIVFPALVTITLFLVSKERLHPATYLRTWPLWLMAVAYLAAWLTYFHAGGTFLDDSQEAYFLRMYEHNLTNRILTCLATFPVYFGLVVWPTGLHLERSYFIFDSLLAWPVLTGAAMVTAVILQIIWGQARRGLALSWAFLWWAVAYSPCTGIVVPVDALVYEHWMYLPTVGIAIGIAQTVAGWLDGKPQKASTVVAVLVPVFAMALGVSTYHQNKVWHDSASLYENAFRYGEQSGRAHDNLGLFYSSQDDFEKAEKQFRMAIAHPSPLAPSMIPALHVNLALAYLRIKPDKNNLISALALRQVLPFSSQTPEAIGELNKALELAPNMYWPNKFLAVIYAYQGDNDKAEYYNERVGAIIQKGEP